MEKTIIEDHIIKDQLLQVMIDNEGSDMYITVGTYPAIKIGGEIIKIDDGLDIFTPKDSMDFALSLITDVQHTRLLQEKNLDFSFFHGDRRFRCNVSFQMTHYMVVLRLLTADIPDIEDLGLPDIYKEVTKLGQGLILVTGPTGSGKTTTLAAMIDYINSNYTKHIITIEDPIEYVHPHKKSIIEHKEIGKDIPDYETGLIGAMRQNPQVILFGEMRNQNEMEMALRLAETGHIVFSTLHTRSAYQTITRILDSFSGEDKNQIRMQLADSLVAVFSQRLLKTTDGTGVKLAKEILVKNAAVANLIRENDLHQIPSVIQMGSREGMQLLETDIIKLIHLGLITEEEGLKYSNNPKLIKESLNA
ncbi:MAG: PilT/PilU family type 4a pilus ATPase [Candidatus Gracilibacteria bacterium]|nr:PilT/PilU family type 4a pilus ATPase [Candidatus Gracilibacteria bacterium]